MGGRRIICHSLSRSFERTHTPWLAEAVQPKNSSALPHCSLLLLLLLLPVVVDRASSSIRQLSAIDPQSMRLQRPAVTNLQPFPAVVCCCWLFVGGGKAQVDVDSGVCQQQVGEGRLP